MAEPPHRNSREHAGMPRWVKVFGLIMAALALLVVAMLVFGWGGEHGPGRHISSSTSEHA